MGGTIRKWDEINGAVTGKKIKMAGPGKVVIWKRGLNNYIFS